MHTPQNSDQALTARLRAVLGEVPPLIGSPRRALGPAGVGGAERGVEPTNAGSSASASVGSGPPTLDASELDASVLAEVSASSTPEQPSRPAQLVGFARSHLGAVIVLVAVILVFVTTRVLSAHAQVISAPTPMAGITSSGSPRTSLSASPGPQPSPSASVLVHVIGAVRHPGVVSLPPGSRVEAAIAAAGGLNPDADPGLLNFAAPAPDGSQIVIGTTAHPSGELREAPGGAIDVVGVGGASSVEGAPLDLNSATTAQLEGLPSVGPVTAQRILQWRSAHGRFSRVEELQEVDGIGPKTYAQIAPHVRV